ncbi:MAG: sigma-70 family RNA polymerase sigma factor [Planctomycetes bacterium]|nr:sigma-70 family RNA polymerase sigma factor [Planctomycetota bacterium]
MSDVTELLKRIDAGDGQAASNLLPLVYDELRKLAARRLSSEPAGQTLQATALVHEAYLRLVDVESPQEWDSRAHFFVAAAEAMRRILVESARRKKSLKRGGELSRQELVESRIAAPSEAGDIEALDEALTAFAAVDPRACEVVKLRCFAGLTLDESAAALGISRRTAARLWTYARAWLHERIE